MSTHLFIIRRRVDFTLCVRAVAVKDKMVKVDFFKRFEGHTDLLFGNDSVEAGEDVQHSFMRTAVKPRFTMPRTAASVFRAPTLTTITCKAPKSTHYRLFYYLMFAVSAVILVRFTKPVCLTWRMMNRRPEPFKLKFANCVPFLSALLTWMYSRQHCVI